MVETEHSVSHSPDDLASPERSDLGHITILTGPTASGKTSIRNALLQRFPSLQPVLNTTTRRQRAGEFHGIDMNFVAHEEFLELVRRRDIVEASHYGGSLYGTLRSDLQGFFQGKNLLWVLPTAQASDIGHTYIRRYGYDMGQTMQQRTTVLYVGVSSLVTLKDRYLQRKEESNDTEEERQKKRKAFLDRLKTDDKEWEAGNAKGKFPHVIFNDDGKFDDAVDQAVRVIQDHRTTLQTSFTP